jgi:TDG/mug DNA glycosylase family protein
VPGAPRTGGTEPWRPTREEIAAARGRTVPDIVAPDLSVLFCGINPSLYSGAVGHHFARPGNRFWKALHGAGFTDRVLSPFEEQLLLDHALGVTNLVRRATARADELSAGELRRGAGRVRRTVCRLQPRMVAFLGMSAFRVAFGRPHATVGPQQEEVCGARLWLLPNPSGLNAHYQMSDLVAAFRELRLTAWQRR